MGWHVGLIMAGVLALMVAMVIIIIMIVFSYHQMSELHQDTFTFMVDSTRTGKLQYK